MSNSNNKTYRIPDDVLHADKKHEHTRKLNTSYILNNEIVSALNSELFQVGISCDLTKVFDCVHHDMSLSKLNFY
jgi:hypothetical protein